MIGTSLGPYRIVEALGAGGMGEVYLAEDTRLGRKVAVKVLPPQFAADAERLARFEQEARAAAALSHPHIATVHDVGSHAGTHFIVQEYLRGQTLRGTLQRGALPLSRTLQLGIEIGEALAAAHRAGIVHRDLKPENVFVSDDGHAKVLDFGLAKLTEQARFGGDQSMSPTVAGTQAGVLMGTAGYMAPEQVRGEEVDHRADLFALGCVLYEMATGERTFTGQTVHGVLDSILSTGPVSLKPLVGAPVELRRIAGKCLAKDAARRYQGAADLVVDLRNLAADVEAGRVTEGVAVAASAGSRWAVVPWLAAAVAIALAAWALSGDIDAASPPTYLTLADPPGPHERGLLGDEADIAISPDGRRILYDVGSGPFYLYDLDRPEPPAPVDGTAGARDPMFSPDGASIGYFLDAALYRRPLAGGNPERVVDSLPRSRLAGVYWGENDRFLYVPGWPYPVFQTSTAEPASILVPLTQEGAGLGLARPSLLPDERVLYSGWEVNWTVEVYDPSSGARQRLFVGGHDARYVHPGYLVYAQDNRLFARTFDLSSLQVGEPVQLLQNVAFESGLGRAVYAISGTGNLAYLTGPGDLERHLVRVDTKAGRRETLPGTRRRYDQHAVLSPDGRRLAVNLLDPAGGREVWIYDLRSGDMTPVARDEGWDEQPFWLDDETVGWSAENCICLNARVADASAPTRMLLETKEFAFWGRSTRQDGVIVGEYTGVQRESGLWTLHPGADEPLRPFLVGTAAGGAARAVFSPDGAFIAYSSERSGRSEIYVRAFPRGTGEADREWRVSRDGGEEPRWLADGRIAYRQGQRVLAQRVDTGPPFVAGEPEVLADGLSGVWDISLDGNFVITAEEFAPPRLVLIQDFAAELARLLPR